LEKTLNRVWPSQFEPGLRWPDGEYVILKEFTVLEKTPNVPGLDLPSLDVGSAATVFAVQAFGAKTKQEIKRAFPDALKAGGLTLIGIPVVLRERPLVVSATD
jgi:benzoylformate decarboxylase